MLDKLFTINVQCQCDVFPIYYLLLGLHQPLMAQLEEGLKEIIQICYLIHFSDDSVIAMKKKIRATLLPQILDWY